MILCLAFSICLEWIRNIRVTLAFNVLTPTIPNLQRIVGHTSRKKSVFDIKNLSKKKKFDFYNRRIITFEDLLDHNILLYFLGFETFIAQIPPYDGARAYQQIHKLDTLAKVKIWERLKKLISF